MISQTSHQRLRNPMSPPSVFSGCSQLIRIGVLIASTDDGRM
jgi:hypothetical protein